MPRISFIHALIIYFACAAALFPFLLWYVDNPDTFQYLAIAHRYADGSFLNVVNAYWSPLVIWLLVLPIKLIGNGIVAFKLLQVLIGAVTLFAWHQLLSITTMDRHWKILLVFAAIPFLLAHALLFLTPDLLFLCFALIILRLVINGGFLSSSRRSIVFGVAGGFWYLAKAFAFPLFIVFLFSNFLIDNERFKIKLKNLLIALSSCAIIIAPWVLAMSLKYGYLTISEAARFNQTVEVAPVPGVIRQLPLLKDGPHVPPPGAISPWEAPGDVIKLTPLRPWTDPSRYLLLVRTNLASIYYNDIRRQLGTPFIVVVLLSLIILKPRQLIRDRIILLPLALLLALNLGYAAILVHDRYIWLNTFIMLFLIGHLLQQLLPDQKIISTFLLIAIVLFAIKRPVKQILFTKDANVPASYLIASLLDPIDTLRRTYFIDQERMRAIETLRPLQLRGPLASLRNSDPERDAYASCLHIAYELGLTYHGEILPHISQGTQLQQLRDHRIRYFAVWNNTPWPSGTILFDKDPPAPKIYQLTP